MGANQSSEKTERVIQSCQNTINSVIIGEPNHCRMVQANQLVCLQQPPQSQASEEARIQTRIREQIHENLRAQFVTISSGSTESTIVQSVNENSRLSQTVTRKILKEKELTYANCSICLQHYKLKQRIIIIPQCGHVFHRDCSESWYQKYGNTTCPNCRSVAKT